MQRNRARNNRGGNDPFISVHPRKISTRDREIFLHEARNEKCLWRPAGDLMAVSKINPEKIKDKLLRQCATIEHQIIMLRALTQLSDKDFDQRYKFTELLLTCLSKHHHVVYEGMLFGSTVNGLGFSDSDVDLRLRPLRQIDTDLYEPIQYDKDMVERVLRDVAYQTTRCCPARGAFVPSTRVPVAKLEFVAYDTRYRPTIESLKYDISLSSTNPFGTLNSRFLRFLCQLEPKFHLLASVIRYWSSVHELIVPGYLSSYALVNMLIFYCQNIEPPLLPTIDFMRDLELNKNDEAGKSNGHHNCITQAEWSCIICLKKELYKKSENAEPLAVLLLKFFEFYLNFPYSSHLITTRPGRVLSHEEYEKSTQFHPGFKLKPYINIQDPFDLAHNLTSGMSGCHFRRLMITMRYSYEKLFKELLNNFLQPKMKDLKDRLRANDNNYKFVYYKPWGLLTILTRLTDAELMKG